MSSPDSEFGQLNMRVPSETVGHLRALAHEDGQKLHPYVIRKLEEHVAVEFLATGREQFMEDLEREHKAETDLYSSLFDRLEAGTF